MKAAAMSSDLRAKGALDFPAAPDSWPCWGQFQTRTSDGDPAQRKAGFAATTQSRFTECACRSEGRNLWNDAISNASVLWSSAMSRR
jgi:hypothetical protein